MRILRKVMRIAIITVGSIFAIVLCSTFAFYTVSALNDEFGTNERVGMASCPVSSMSVDYSVDKPPKTQWVRLYCDAGTWGFAWLSERAGDGWRQPQELLDNVKIGDAFNCARWQKKGWVGNKYYYHYRDCELKS